MSETLQTHNISLYPGMKEWVKEQVVKTYANTQQELQQMKISIENKSLEKELTMTNVLNVLKKAESSMREKKATISIFNEMGAGLVMAIQIALKKLNYNPGVIDGIYRNQGAKEKSNTERAVIDFQSANNLVADGIAGPLTLAKLSLAFENVLSQPQNIQEKKEVKEEKKEVKEEKKEVKEEKKEVKEKKKEVKEEKKEEKEKKKQVKVENEKKKETKKEENIIIENKEIPEIMQKISAILKIYLPEKDAIYYQNLLQKRVDQNLLDPIVVQKELQQIIDDSLQRNIPQEKITGKILFKIYLLLQSSLSDLRKRTGYLTGELTEITTKYFNKKTEKYAPMTSEDEKKTITLKEELSLLLDAYDRLAKTNS